MDRNTQSNIIKLIPGASLSARRAWIEITILILTGLLTRVALRKESVDRNCPPGPLSFLFGAVALRKESVDRNILSKSAMVTSLLSLSARRAWIEIPITLDSGALPGVSLSARRAWIEIPRFWRQGPAPLVALRKESVDRNKLASCAIYYQRTSLSARRAWIEIFSSFFIAQIKNSRSPQGERG